MKKSTSQDPAQFDSWLEREISYKPMDSETKVTLRIKDILRYMCKKGRITEQDISRFIRLCSDCQLDSYLANFGENTNEPFCNRPDETAQGTHPSDVPKI